MRQHLRKTMGAGLLSLALLASLSGCLQTAQTPQASSPGAQESGLVTTNAIPPEENQPFSPPAVSWDSSLDGKGFYLPGWNILEYYDPETQTRTPLCSQSGCTHADESCQAWLSNQCMGFTSYGDAWYVSAIEDDTHAVLWNVDPKTSQRTKLCDIAPQNNQENYYFSSGYVSHGYAYLTLQHQLIWDEQWISESSLIRVNLADGTMETLVEDVPVTFLGAEEDRVLLAVETFAVQPLSEEEYLKQHPDGNYYTYLQLQLEENGSGGVELREYTWDMSDYQVLAKGNIWASPSWTLRSYGDNTLYAVDNALYVYNLSTGESRKVAEEATLKNFLIIAGHIFYAIQDDQYNYTFYRTDLQGGPVEKLENEGKTEVAALSVAGECKDYVYGLYEDEECLMTKEDYFAERYENIIPIS